MIIVLNPKIWGEHWLLLLDQFHLNRFFWKNKKMWGWKIYRANCSSWELTSERKSAWCKIDYFLYYNYFVIKAIRWKCLIFVYFLNVALHCLIWDVQLCCPRVADLSYLLLDDCCWKTVFTGWSNRALFVCLRAFKLVWRYFHLS